MGEVLRICLTIIMIGATAIISLGILFVIIYMIRNILKYMDGDN